MTKDEWTKVEQKLTHLYSSVKLRCDGYNLTLCVVPNGPLKLAIAWYVDGEFKGVFLKNDPEIGKRFACPHVLHVYRPAQKTKIIKDFGKRGAARLFPQLDATHTYRSWVWESFKSLKRHLIANNQSISLVGNDELDILTSEQPS